MSAQAGAGLMLRPAGASAGSARWSAALKEFFRSEPQIVTMFRTSAMSSPRELRCDVCDAGLDAAQRAAGMSVRTAPRALLLLDVCLLADRLPFGDLVGDMHLELVRCRGAHQRADPQYLRPHRVGRKQRAHCRIGALHDPTR